MLKGFLWCLGIFGMLDFALEWMIGVGCRVGCY